MKRITFRKLLEAVRLNGYTQAKLMLWRTDLEDSPQVLGSACALGQAYLNLGIATDGELENINIMERFKNYEYYKDMHHAQSAFLQDRLQNITTLNDSSSSNLTPPEIADQLEKDWEEKGYLDIAFEADEADYNKQFSNYQGVKL